MSISKTRCSLLGRKVRNSVLNSGSGERWLPLGLLPCEASTSNCKNGSPKSSPTNLRTIFLAITNRPKSTDEPPLRSEIGLLARRDWFP